MRRCATVRSEEHQRGPACGPLLRGIPKSSGCGWGWRIPKLFPSAGVSLLCCSLAPGSTGCDVWKHRAGTGGMPKAQVGSEGLRTPGVGVSFCCAASSVSTSIQCSLEQCLAHRTAEQNQIYGFTDKAGTTVWPGVNHHHSAEINTVLGYLVVLLKVWQYLVHCLEPQVLFHMDA